MACLALTSLKESIEPFVVNHFPYEGSVVVYSLVAKVRDSLQIVKYFSKRSDTAQQFKLVEGKVRIAACEAEYSSQQFTQHDNLSLKILLSKVDDIEFLITDLFKILRHKFFNLEEQLSYVVSSSASNSYEIHHQFVFNYTKYRSSYLKKLRRMLARIASPIRVEKNEVVDFLISNVNSDLGLLGIKIDGSGNGMESRNLARYIYTDTRMKNSFPIRAWVTVFVGDQTKDLLKCLLHSVMEDFSFNGTYKPRLGEMSSQQLYECLCSHLEGQRYFIVIDSLQDPAFDSISYPFPDKKNGSRILFINNVGMPYGSTSKFGITSKINLVLSSLEEGQLHKMFHNLVFGGRRCPGELKTMVSYILNSCPGSPFAVFMIANYLSTINQTTDNWLIVRKSIQNTAYRYSNLVHRIISALLEASESIHADERSVFTQKCEAKNKHPERFKHLSASSEVAKANDYEHVGLEECLDQLVPELLRSSLSPQLEKIAIAGMAGIGKTTLAKRIFDDTSISDHFHIRAWIRISQFYLKRSLLIQLLQDITQLTDSEILNESDAQLEEKLYKCLKGQRYLIIMDDVWSIEAWSELKRTFPDDKMGSRILLTSRESNFFESLGCKIIHHMIGLSEKHSWGLLQKKVFGQEICPQGLAVIGKKIAERCEGLPLAIVVVAGVLSKIGKTVDNWKAVAVSVSSHVMGSATRAIFSLSYEHLPDCLKSCFLYMGAFPGGYEIEVRKLIRLWIAEGFISSAYPKSLEDIAEEPKSLEDIAEEYLDDLIGRSLLLSGRRRSNGKVKTCRLHDLVLEFCVQEARKDKFLDVIKDFGRLDSQATNDGQHRFSFHCHTFDDVYLTASKSHACSALFFSVSSHLVPDILLPYFDFKLLRVLDLISWRFDNFPTEQVERLLLLRYLALTASFELPGQLFRLQKLQTLIINGPWLWSYKIPILPPEIWRSTSLRHLQLRVANHLVSPEKSTEAKYLGSLQTLTKITLGSCTHETFSSIPYILELGVCETHEDLPVVGLWDSFFQNLVLLKHIQTLKISCFGHGRPLPLRSLDAFPKGLKKLTLRHSNLPWEAITLIGDLPNLEVLKLRNNAFKGPEWETREGGFQKLKYLLIEETDLRHWELESHHFPHLEQLVLKCCEVLEEIPTEIGDIPTLAHIKLDNCCSSVERSAKDIREEQSEYGHDIKIKIRTQQTLSSTSLKEMDE